MKPRLLFCLFAVLLFDVAACAADPGDSIGVATMTPDGTITLRLRAEGNSNGDRIIGDGILVYKTDNPDYPKIIKHLGGLHPGESKSVPPWP